MTSRHLVWTLAILAIVLVVVPLLGMVGMMGTGRGCCGGMMGMGSNMIGMSAVAVIWMLAGAGVVIALIVVLVRATTRT